MVFLDSTQHLALLSILGAEGVWSEPEVMFGGEALNAAYGFYLALVSVDDDAVVLSYLIDAHSSLREVVARRLP